MKRSDDKRNDEERGVPVPTESFRRQAWRQFERALDPLAPPRLLPRHRRPH